jgi:imidazolonepropionase-like amidohydrolase
MAIRTEGEIPRHIATSVRMRPRSRSALVVMLAAVAAVLGVDGATGSSQGATVLQVGLLIDGNGGEPIKDAVIVIDGKRIQAVGKSGEVTVPAGAEIIQLKDKTIIPGLIDTHAHYREWNGELYIANGVTTAYDVGDNPLVWSMAQRDGIAKGKIVGPRLLLGGRMNGVGDEDVGEGGSRGRTEQAIKTPDEARKKVRELLAADVDAIKALDALSSEQLSAIADEAHKAGKIVITHSVNGIEAVLAGIPIDDIEHSHSVIMGTVGSEEARKKLHEDRSRPTDRMTSQEVHSFMEEAFYDRTIQAMLAQKTSWSPTMATAWRAFSPQRERYEAAERKLFADPALAYIPPYFKRNTEEYFAGTAKLDPKLDATIHDGYAKLKDFVRRFAQAGGKLQTGSDPNAGLPAVLIHTEMALFVEAGLTPMQALMAATRNPAERQGRLKDFGTVSPGTFADFVVLDANPLDDIAATQQISMVFQEGRAIKPPFYHANYRNPILRPQADRQEPEIDSVSPASIVEGSESVTLTVMGRNFLNTDVVKVNGKPVPAEVKFRPAKFPQNFRRGRELSVKVPAELIKAAGLYPVVVEHPGAGGAVSSPAYLVVTFK